MRIIPPLGKEVFEEIKEKLTEQGYHVSPNYGLISKKENESDFEKMKGPVLADIRYFEEKVVLPYWNKIESVDVSNLRKILTQADIPFREVMQAAD